MMQCSSCESNTDMVLWGPIPMQPVCNQHIQKNGYIYVLSTRGSMFYINGVAQKPTGPPATLESLEKLCHG